MEKTLGYDFDTVVATILSVGQGTSNLIEGYNGGHLVFLALIDCGGGGDNHGNVQEAKKQINDKMAERAKTLTSKDCTHFLDYYILSHFDKDHFDIFDRIISQINATNLKVVNNTRTKTKKAKRSKSFLTDSIFENIGCEAFRNNSIDEADILIKFQTVTDYQNPFFITDYFYWELYSFIITDNKLLEMQDDDEMEENLFLHYHQHQRYDWTFPGRLMALTSTFENSEVVISISDRVEGGFNIFFQYNSDSYKLEKRIIGIYKEDKLELTTNDDIFRVYGSYPCSYQIINFFYAVLDFFRNKILLFYPIVCENLVKTANRIRSNINQSVYDNFFQKNGYGRATKEEISRETDSDSSDNEKSEADANANKLKIGTFLHGHVGKKGTAVPSILHTLESYSNNAECIKEDWLIQTANKTFKLHVIPPAPADLVKDVYTLFNKGTFTNAANNSGKNQFSLIVVLEEVRHKHKIIFSGDATVQSMFWFYCNKKSILQGKGTINHLVAPHHGSEETSRGSYVAKNTATGKEETYDILKEFIKLVEAKNVLISAGICNRHAHPNREFIERCLTKLVNTSDGHTIYIFYRDCKTTNKTSLTNYAVYNLKYNLFTTVATVPSASSSPVKLCYYNYEFKYESGKVNISTKSTYEENYGGTVEDWPPKST